MAEIRMVLVHGQPFAVASTENNANLLMHKINKLYADNPAEVAPSTVLYNPKHDVAIELLDELGLARASEDAETATGVRLTLPSKAAPVRKGARKTA